MWRICLQTPSAVVNNASYITAELQGGRGWEGGGTENRPTDACCRAHASICYNCVLSAIRPTACAAVLAGLPHSASAPVDEKSSCSGQLAPVNNEPCEAFKVQSALGQVQSPAIQPQ